MEEILASLRLPRLILIGDGFTQPDRRQRILDAAEHVPWVHLRDPDASAEVFRKHARELVKEIRERAPDCKISVNGNLKAAEELEVAFHTGTDGPSVSEARKLLGPEPTIGYSAHYLTEAQAAAADGADYVFFSPIFASPSKPGFVGVGVGELREFCERLGDAAYVFALGGITPKKVEKCLEAGAYGVAVHSGIMHEDDLKAASEAYLDELQKLA